MCDAGLHYAIPYPHREFETGRQLRMSPIYPKLKEAGGVFGQVMGYERPNWFDMNFAMGNYFRVFCFLNVRLRILNISELCLVGVGDSKNMEVPFRIAKSPSFYKPVWFDLVSEEYTACREAVGLIDYSSYTKIDLWVRNTTVDFMYFLKLSHQRTVFVLRSLCFVRS